MKTQVSKSVITALLSNLFVTVLKFIGFAFSGSASLFSEAVHSMIDVINQLLLAIGQKTSSLESTADHPFGKGSYLYLFNFMSAVGIFFIGCVVTVSHSVSSLINPKMPTMGMVFFISISILIISIIVEGYSLHVVIKEINKNKKDLSFMEYVFKGSNPTLSAIFLEDSIAVFGVFLALLGQFSILIFKNSILDAVFGMIIGLMLGFMAIFLGYVNAQLLIGKSAGSEKETEIKKFLEALPLIDSVHDLRTEILKPNCIAVIAEVEFNGSALFNSEQVEKQLDKDTTEIQNLMIDNVDDRDKLKRILVKMYSRTNRLFGKRIDEIQAQVKKEFPDVVLITLEMK